jgi:hypothetical protein
VTEADVARNGLREKVKRNGCKVTRRRFEQHARFLRKWMCGKQSTALRSAQLPTRPRTVPNPDRLIRAPFNNRDYGHHAQTPIYGVQSGPQCVQVRCPSAIHSAGLPGGYLPVHRECGRGEAIADDSAAAAITQIINPLGIGTVRSYSASWL